MHQCGYKLFEFSRYHVYYFDKNKLLIINFMLFHIYIYTQIYVHVHLLSLISLHLSSMSSDSFLMCSEICKNIIFLLVLNELGVQDWYKNHEYSGQAQTKRREDCPREESKREVSKKNYINFQQNKSTNGLKLLDLTLYPS